MPLWLSIALPLVVAVLTVVTNAVINRKIKFAPSKDVATRELKLLTFVKVRRVSDKKRFALPLKNLKATEGQSSHDQLLHDYAVWLVNWR